IPVDDLIGDGVAETIECIGYDDDSQFHLGDDIHSGIEPIRRTAMGQHPFFFVVGDGPAHTISSLRSEGISLSTDHLWFPDLIHLRGADDVFSVVFPRCSQLHQKPFVEIMDGGIDAGSRSGIVPVSSLDRNYLSLYFLMWKSYIVRFFYFGDAGGAGVHVQGFKQLLFHELIPGSSIDIFDYLSRPIIHDIIVNKTRTIGFLRIHKPSYIE